MRRLVALTLLLLVTGCATKQASVPAGPPAYRDGYAMGCDSGYVAAGHPYYTYRKDAERAVSDPLYASGWNDGFAVCKGKYDSITRMGR